MKFTTPSDWVSDDNGTYIVDVELPEDPNVFGIFGDFISKDGVHIIQTFPSPLNRYPGMMIRKEYANVPFAELIKTKIFRYIPSAIFTETE